MESVYDTFDLDSSYRDTIFGLEGVLAQVSVYENVICAVGALASHDCSRGLESFYRQFSLEEESTGAVNGSSAEAPEQTSSSVDESEKKDNSQTSEKKPNWFIRMLRTIKEGILRAARWIRDQFVRFWNWVTGKSAPQVIEQKEEAQGTIANPEIGAILEETIEAVKEIGEEVKQSLNDSIKKEQDSFKRVEEAAGGIVSKRNDKDEVEDENKEEPKKSLKEKWNDSRQKRQEQKLQNHLKNMGNGANKSIFQKIGLTKEQFIHKTRNLVPVVKRAIKRALTNEPKAFRKALTITFFNSMCMSDDFESAIKMITKVSEEYAFLAKEDMENVIRTYMSSNGRRVVNVNQDSEYARYIHKYSLLQNKMSMIVRNINMFVETLHSESPKAYFDNLNKMKSAVEGDNKVGVDNKDDAAFKLSELIVDKFNKPFVTSTFNMFKNWDYSNLDYITEFLLKDDTANEVKMKKIYKMKSLGKIVDNGVKGVTDFLYYTTKKSDSIVKANRKKDEKDIDEETKALMSMFKSHIGLAKAYTLFFNTIGSVVNDYVKIVKKGMDFNSGLYKYRQ